MVTLPCMSKNSSTSILTNESSSNVEGQQLCYFIMERYDETLEHHIQALTKNGNKLEPSECIEIAL